MSSFRVYGLDQLEVDLAQLAQISDDERWAILERGGEVLRAAQQKYLDLNHHLTGQLSASLKLSKKSARGGELTATIGASGKRKGGFTGKRLKKDKNGRRRSSGHYEGSNAEVLYFLEYGTPRMPATHGIETTNEAAAPDVQAAMEEAWDEYLKSKGF